MKIIDNFLNKDDFLNLKNNLKNISLLKDRNANYTEDRDHKNLQKSNFYNLNYDDLVCIFDELKSRNIIKNNYIDELPYARYHVTKKPYYSKFHRDSLSFDKNEYDIDHIGVTIFFNDTWSEEWGGLYTYRIKNTNKNYESYTQKYLKPISNRCIINTTDVPHAVTKLKSPDNIERKSLQIFLDAKYFI